MYQVDKNTVSLLHFDDGIKDETGKVWAAQNGVAVSTGNKVFGDSGLCLNGSSQYLTTPSNIDFNFGSGEFTVEAWVKWNSYANPSKQVIVAQGDSASFNTSVSFVLEILADGSANGAMCGGSSYYNVASEIKIIDNNWHHVAFVRQVTSLKIFVDGILQGSTVVPVVSINNSSYPLTIGRAGDSSQWYFNGCIDEFRISNIARWTSDFDSENPDNPDSKNLLLTVTLAEEVEREYGLTKDQVDAFVNWYIARSGGTGPAYYTFDKSFKRKDYLPFDKIITFEVTDFVK